MMHNIRQFGALLLKLNYILDSRQRRTSVGVFVVIVFGTLLEMLGVSAILPFVQALTDTQTLMEMSYIQFLMNLFGISTSQSLILMVGIAIILIYILKNIFLSFSYYVQVRFRTSMRMQMKHQMMKAYMKRPYTFFVKTNSGDILRGVSSDIAGTQVFVENLFKFFSEILVVLLISIYIFHEDPVITLGVVVIAILVFVITVFGLKRKTSHLGKMDLAANGDINRISLEMTRGIKDILIKKKQNFYLDIYDKSIDKYRKTQSAYQFISSLPDRLIEAACICGIIAIVLIRILMGIDNLTFVPKLAVFAVAAFRMLPSMTRIIGSANSMIYHRPCVESVYENIKSAREYIAQLSTQKENGEEELVNGLQQKITVNHISWRYDGTEKDVLRGLNMVIYKGESIGIIGESGTGKSTLADILLGLYRPQEGTVEIDGKNIYEISNAWSRIVGYVPQNVFLRDNTVRENIAFGEKEIDDTKVWKALQSASLSDFVKGLPQGLDTVVGENGIKFSGGQKQRLAIARALYFDPDVLILDEATSALDTETEAAVMEAIEALKGTITMIIIAHRLTTIRKCDRIYEIKDKRAFEVEKASVLQS